MFWYAWWFCAGALLTLWVRRLPSEREYERFLMMVGVKGRQLTQRLNAYADAQAGLANWRRRRYWRQQIARHGRPARVRSVVLALALCGLWPVLTASAPVRQSCTEQTASYLVRRVVERTITSNGQPLTIPAGFAVGWGCTSVEAEAAWQQAADQVGR